MRILFIGDVFGRSGRDAIKEHLGGLKDCLQPDVVITNVDNAANGRGTTVTTAEEILGYGVDILTGGDHIWDQREMVCGVENIKQIIRPYNLPIKTPGRGIIEGTFAGHKLTVVHLCGTTFMSKTFDNAFDAADKILETVKLSNNHSIFVDFHAEATSEKMALGQYLDGKVTAVIGSHTHIPTADAQILPNGTAYQTDAGMTGDYNSVIGVKPSAPIGNFKRTVPNERMVPTDGEATLCGTLIEVNEQGLAVNIAPVRVGGRLSKSMPDF